MEFNEFINQERDERSNAFIKSITARQNVKMISAEFSSSLLKDGRVVFYGTQDEVINKDGPKNVKQIAAGDNYILLRAEADQVWKYNKGTKTIIELPYKYCNLIAASKDHYFIQGMKNDTNNVRKIHMEGHKNIDLLKPAFEQLNQLGEIDQLSFGEDHYVALHNGDLIVWGQNYCGQLGFAKHENQILSPRKLPFPEKVKKVVCTDTATIILDMKYNVYVTGKLCRVGKFENKFGFEKVPLKEPAKDIFASSSGSVIITAKIMGAYGYGLNYCKNLGLANTGRPHIQDYYFVLQPEKIPQLGYVQVKNIIMRGEYTYVQGKEFAKNHTNLLYLMKSSFNDLAFFDVVFNFYTTQGAQPHHDLNETKTEDKEHQNSLEEIENDILVRSDEIESVLRPTKRRKTC
jgi:hypothetical protein